MSTGTPPAVPAPSKEDQAASGVSFSNIREPVDVIPARDTNPQKQNYVLGISPMNPPLGPRTPQQNVAQSSLFQGHTQ